MSTEESHPQSQVRTSSGLLVIGTVLLVGISWLFWENATGGSGQMPGSAMLDVSYYHYPTYKFQYQDPLSFEVPLWNPYQLCGVPGIATLQGGFFYPGHLLYRVLPTLDAMMVSAWLHLVLVGVFSAVLALRIGLLPPAALLAGILASIGGIFPHMAAGPNALEAASWGVPGCLAILLLLQHRKAGFYLLALSVALTHLAGRPQMALYNHYTWALLLVSLLILQRSPRSTWLRAGSLFGAAILTGTALAGIQLLPALELIQLTVRETASLSDQLAAASFPMPNQGAIPRGWIAIAAIPLALLNRPHRRVAAAMLFVAAVTYVFSLGFNTPLFEVLRNLPGISWFRFPTRVVFVTDFSLAIVAATGLDFLLRRFPTGIGRGMVALGVGIICAKLLWAPTPGMFVSYEPNRQINWYEAPRPAYDVIATNHDRVWIAAATIVPAIPRKLPMVFGIRGIEDYEPLSTRRHSEFFTYLRLGDQGLEEVRGFFVGMLIPGFKIPDPEGLLGRLRLLDLTAIRFLLVRPPMKSRYLRRILAQGGWTRHRASDHQILLFEKSESLPRAFVAYNVSPAPPTRDLLARMSDPGFDPLVQSFVESPGDLGLPSSSLRGAPATIVLDQAHVVEVEANLEVDGFLILADSFYPGWKATVDGRPADILPANHLFRGTPVPAGLHRIRFEYAPESYKLGKLLTLGGAALFLLGIVPIRWRLLRSRI